ncbi:MAG: phosphatidic acid phosphatase, partial [Bacteroidota bacterium]
MKHTSLWWGLVLFLAAACWSGCQPSHNTNYQADAANPEVLHQSMARLTDVIIHDIFSPPAASRVYVYPAVAAYEVMALA